MFPTPLSARVLVRKSLAAVIREMGNILAGEVEAILAEEARARRGLYEKVKFVGPDKVDSDAKVSPKERRVRKIAKRVITVVVCSAILVAFACQHSCRFRRDYKDLCHLFLPRNMNRSYRELIAFQSRFCGSFA
jgi:hypothetical protein